MPYYHATWSRHLPSIRKHGLGGAMPDMQNFPVEAGVYLSTDPAVAISMMIEAYVLNGEDWGMSPPEALVAMCVIVVDDSRIDQRMIDVDPNVERRDMTILYRGVIDVAALPILSVNDVIPPDAMAENEAKAVLGLE
jgi:hypothetical protein